MPSVLPVPLLLIDSEADYIVVAPAGMVISEHRSISEAVLSFYNHAAKIKSGVRMPHIFKRTANQWMPVE